MRVAMMDIGIMRVRMFQPLMPVGMGVRLARRIARRVLVLVMHVVRMFVLMGHCFMNVPVLMSFRNVQPDSRSHKNTSCSESGGDRLSPENDSSDSPDKWRNRKVITRARCAEVAKRQDVEDETQAVADKTECQRDPDQPREVPLP